MRYVLLFSSAATEQYRETVLRILTYPRNHVLTDVPYRFDLVAPEFSPPYDGLRDEECVFCLVDYFAGTLGRPERIFYPLRLGKIRRVASIALKLLLDVELGDFVYYDDEARALYQRERFEAPTADETIGPRTWNRTLRSQGDALHAVSQSPNQSAPMRFDDATTWKSGGFFVVRSSNDLDFRPRGIDPHLIAKQQRDWQSVVDEVSEASKLKQKIFYQIQLLQGSVSPVPLKRSKSFRFSIYDLDADARTDLLLHFFVKKGQPSKKESTLVKIETDNDLVVTVGKNLIPIYPDSSSGQLERIQVIAKRQLSTQYVQISVCALETKDTSVEPRLVNAEIYLRIKPRRLFIGLILVLFFVGTFLNATGDDSALSKIGPAWAIKVLGTGFTVTAFWLAFSRFPSKGD